MLFSLGVQLQPVTISKEHFYCKETAKDRAYCRGQLIGHTQKGQFSHKCLNVLINHQSSFHLKLEKNGYMI